MYIYEDKEIENLSKSERSLTIRIYLEILAERQRVTSEIFDVLKRIRDTSENDREFGENIKLFLKNR